MEWTPVNTSYTDIFRYLKAKHPEYRKPPAMPRFPGRTVDNSRYCEHHQDYGHTVEQCRTLRNWIEKLIKGGELQQYVRDSPQPDPATKQKITQPPKGGEEAEAEEQNRDLIPIYSITGGYRP